MSIDFVTPKLAQRERDRVAAATAAAEQLGKCDEIRNHPGDSCFTRKRPHNNYNNDNDSLYDQASALCL